MKNQATYVDDLDPVSVTTVGEDHALVDLKGQRVVMTYDAAFELATRLAAWVQRTGDSATGDFVLN